MRFAVVILRREASEIMRLRALNRQEFRNGTTTPAEFSAQASELGRELDDLNAAIDTLQGARDGI